MFGTDKEVQKAFSNLLIEDIVFRKKGQYMSETIFSNLRITKE